MPARQGCQIFDQQCVNAGGAITDPGESWEYEAVWNMIHDNGTLEPEDDFPIGAGKYKVTDELLGEKVFVLIAIQ